MHELIDGSCYYNQSALKPGSPDGSNL